MIVAASLLAMSTVSCSDKDNEGIKNNEGGNYVSFSVGKTASRTIREEGNKYQIDWVQGDAVRVYSDKAATASNEKYADYTVNPNEQTKKTGTLGYNENGLLWPETEQQCNFYAVYPSTAATACDNGTVTLTIPTSQKAQVKGDAADGVYTCGIDMNNAYMVASANGSNSPISLKFSPIMTTLDMTLVNNMENSSDLTVTSVSIEIDNSQIATSENGTFQYAMSGTTYMKTDPNATNSVTVKTSLSTDDETSYVKLAKGQSVKFTTFLPPIQINKGRTVKVRVNCIEGNTAVMELGTQTVDGKELSYASSSLSDVKLTITKLNDKKDWMDDIDDNTLMCQLSLPGVNEAFSSLSEGNMKNQTLTFDEQVALGYRAFDFKTLYADLSVDGKSTNANVTNKINISTLCQKYFCPFVYEHPKEFIIVMLHDDYSIESYTDFQNFTYWPDNKTGVPFKNLFIEYKETLTLGQCRGKIIMATYGYGYTSNAKTNYVGLLSALEDGCGKGTWYTKDSTPNAYYYYGKNSSDNASTRVGKIKQYFESARKNGKINFCYLAGYDKDQDNTAGYQANAKDVHPAIKTWLESQQTYGPLGSVFMDYVGTDEIGGTKVYGNELPQLIISQNYKFKLKKKGDK